MVCAGRRRERRQKKSWEGRRGDYGPPITRGGGREQDQSQEIFLADPTGDIGAWCAPSKVWGCSQTRQRPQMSPLLEPPQSQLLASPRGTRGFNPPSCEAAVQT